MARFDKNVNKMSRPSDHEKYCEAFIVAVYEIIIRRFRPPPFFFLSLTLFFTFLRFPFFNPPFCFILRAGGVTLNPDVLKCCLAPRPTMFILNEHGLIITFN